MGKKYRKHSWKELATWRPGYKSGDITQAFQCRRCGTVAWASRDFMKKINKPRQFYYKNPQVQIFQERRRRLNSHLETWIIENISPSSIDCDLIPIAEIMEN